MPFINIIFGRNLLTGDFVAVLLAFWWSYETAGTEHKVGTIECIGGFRGGRTGSGPRLEPVAGHELYTCAGQEKNGLIGFGVWYTTHAVFNDRLDPSASFLATFALFFHEDFSVL